MVDYSLFGEKIKIYRNKLNLTLEAFGEKVQKDSNEISRLEKCKHNPNIETVISILNAYNINLNKLYDVNTNTNVEYDEFITNEITKNFNTLSETEKVFFIDCLKSFEGYLIKRGKYGE